MDDSGERRKAEDAHISCGLKCLICVSPSTGFSHDISRVINIPKNGRQLPYC